MSGIITGCFTINDNDYRSTAILTYDDGTKYVCKYSLPELIDYDSDILRIDSDGNIERSEFFAYNDISTLYSLARKTPWDKYYINQLKEIASCFGVDPQYVDLLYENGFSADEIEELLYEPEELMNYADVLEYEGLYF